MKHSLLLLETISACAQLFRHSLAYFELIISEKFSNIRFVRSNSVDFGCRRRAARRRRQSRERLPEWLAEAGRIGRSFVLVAAV